MNKYRKAVRPKVPMPANFIFISSKGKLKDYINYGLKCFLQSKMPFVVIRGVGKAIASSITLAEYLKHRIKNLYQDSVIKSEVIQDVYMPLEEGLDIVTVSRNIIIIEITLSRQQLNNTGYGYQKPIPESLVHEISPAYQIQAQKRGNRIRGHTGQSSKRSSLNQRGRIRGQQVQRRSFISGPRRGRGNFSQDKYARNHQLMEEKEIDLGIKHSDLDVEVLWEQSVVGLQETGLQNIIPIKHSDLIEDIYKISQLENQDSFQESKEENSQDQFDDQWLQSEDSQFQSRSSANNFSDSESSDKSNEGW